MNEVSRENTGLIVVLLVMTAATGILDAVSYLGPGHVFTANMIGNIVRIGFRLGGALRNLFQGSVIILFCFMLGAVTGVRMGRRPNPRKSRIGRLGPGVLGIGLAIMRMRGRAVRVSRLFIRFHMNEAVKKEFTAKL